MKTKTVIVLLKEEYIMHKMPKIEELTKIVEKVKTIIELQELMSIVAFDAKEKEMLNRRILLTKQLGFQLALANDTIKELNKYGTGE